ncbi:MAG TPA: hypothetical protein VK548_29475 [Candidatus Acidoferrum sp.]|nr:hypothetical protein [Candidatus Acidoferrum sp.]
MSDEPGPVAKTTTDVNEIKRTSGPQTSNGKRWQVQINATPSREWRELFKASGDSSNAVTLRRLEFDDASLAFESDEDHVQPWITAIDKWIASTNARHRTSLERVRRERSERLDADAKERERIRQLNDRFKDL